MDKSVAKTQRSLQSPPARVEDRPRSSAQRTRAPTPTPTPTFWAVCGLVAFAIIGSGAAWVVRARAALAASPTPVVSAPKPRLGPPVALLVQSVAPSAKLQFRGATITLPYQGEVAFSKTPEPLEVSAPGFQGRRFWIKLDRARSFTIALPQGSGTDDATYEETVVAMGAGRAHDQAP